MLCQQWDARTHFIHAYIRTHAHTRTSSTILASTLKTAQCGRTLSSYALHMILTINSDKCLYLLSELRK
jgi:hypothetical protein